jgi:hypothetical protein
MTADEWLVEEGDTSAKTLKHQLPKQRRGGDPKPGLTGSGCCVRKVLGFRNVFPSGAGSVTRLQL